MREKVGELGHILQVELGSQEKKAPRVLRCQLAHEERTVSKKPQRLERNVRRFSGNRGKRGPSGCSDSLSSHFSRVSEASLAVLFLASQLTPEHPWDPLFTRFPEEFALLAFLLGLCGLYR